jgi:cytoskeletal protein RodZ
VTMRSFSSHPRRLVRHPFRLLSAGLLGVACAVLVACGSSGKGLIPAASAGPLQSDFEAVAQAAAQGNGDCTATQEAIAKTEADFQTLPTSVNSALRERLRVGIANLSSRARDLCTQPLPAATTTTTPTTTSTSANESTTSSTSTSTSTTTSTPTSSTVPTPTGPSAPGGGTPAPGEGGNTPGPGDGNGSGQGNGEGTGAGGAGVGSGQGNGEGNGPRVGQ